MTNDAIVPGSKCVLHHPNRGTEYWCTYCKKYINAHFAKAGDFTYPTCPDCFIREMDMLHMDLGDAEEEDLEEIAAIEGEIVDGTDEVLTVGTA